MICFACHKPKASDQHFLLITQLTDNYKYDLYKLPFCRSCTMIGTRDKAFIKCATCGEIYTVKREMALSRLNADEMLVSLVNSDIIVVRLMPACPNCLKGV